MKKPIPAKWLQIPTVQRGDLILAHVEGLSDAKIEKVREQLRELPDGIWAIIYPQESLTRAAVGSGAVHITTLVSQEDIDHLVDCAPRRFIHINVPK